MHMSCSVPPTSFQYEGLEYVDGEALNLSRLKHTSVISALMAGIYSTVILPLCGSNSLHRGSS